VFERGLSICATAPWFITNHANPDSDIASLWSCVTLDGGHRQFPMQPVDFRGASCSRNLASRFDRGSSIKKSFGRRISARPERHALLLAAGKVGGGKASADPIAQQFRHFLDLFGPVIRRHTAHAQREIPNSPRTVFEGLQRIVLEHHRHVAIARIDVGHVRDRPHRGCARRRE